MAFLQELLTPLASLLHLPLGVVVFASLMLIGTVGHFVIYQVVED